jgi:hypothetical protein
MEASLLWVFLLAFFGIIYKLLNRSSYKDTQFGFKGKLIYMDKGRKSPSFVDREFNIAAKPDFIYQLKNKNSYALVEYKSRNGKVYPSDIAQLKASVLAARSRYYITNAYACTESVIDEINVNKSNKYLFEDIRSAYELTVDIVEGKTVNVCYKSKYKCPTCSMNKHCKFSV